MGTIAIVMSRKSGTSYKRRVQLLGSSDESLEKDGLLHYRIPEELIEILRNSEVYARLKTQVMYWFESKYALCLYEMIERRIGLEYKHSEEFTIAEDRKSVVWGKRLAVRVDAGGGGIIQKKQRQVKI